MNTENVVREIEVLRKEVTANTNYLKSMNAQLADYLLFEKTEADKCQDDGGPWYEQYKQSQRIGNV
jgi:hypothetical protein